MDQNQWARLGGEKINIMIPTFFFKIKKILNVIQSMFSHITISIKIFLMTEIIQYYTKKKKRGIEYIPLGWYWLNKKKGYWNRIIQKFWGICTLAQKIIWNENIHYGLPLG